MQLHWILSAIFEVVSLFVVMTTQSSDHRGGNVTPVGPRMCERLCNQMIGCSSFVYKVLDLSCRLIITSLDTLTTAERKFVFKVSKSKLRLLAEGNMSCSKGTRIHLTSRNVLRCTRGRFKERQQRKYSKLLLYLKNNQARQLHLNNNSMVKYPGTLRMGRPSVLKYSAASKRFIVACFNPQELFLMSLGGVNKSVVSKKYKINMIAVADEKRFVFLATHKPKSINVMTTEGRDLRLFIKTTDKIINIAADSERHILYVNQVVDRIIKCNYTGVKLGNVVTGRYLCKFMFSDSEALYVLKSHFTRSVTKIFLSNYSSYEFNVNAVLDYRMFYVFSQRIFDYSQGGNILNIFSDTGEKITRIDTSFGAPIFKKCAIP